MKPLLPSLCIWLGGALLAAASGLFWYVILTPDLPLRQYTIATVALFAAGVLLVTFTPLLVGARATAPASSRGTRRASQKEVASGRGQLAARLLIWAILALYVGIALIG